MRAYCLDFDSRQVHKTQKGECIGHWTSMKIEVQVAVMLV